MSSGCWVILLGFRKGYKVVKIAHLISFNNKWLQCIHITQHGSTLKLSIMSWTTDSNQQLCSFFFFSSNQALTSPSLRIWSYTVHFLIAVSLILMSCLPSVTTLFSLHYPLSADQLCSVLSPPLLDLLDVLDANSTTATGAERPRLFPGWAFPRNDQWLTVGRERKVRHTVWG